jgi:hypothetical protein
MSESILTLWINSETNTLHPNWNAFGTASIPPLKQGDIAKVEVHWIKSDSSGIFMQEIEMPQQSTIKIAIGRTSGGPTSGFFTYSFGGDTVDIPYDATEQDAHNLINSIPSIISAGGVVVSIVNQRTFRIVFNNFGPQPLSSCDATNLRPSTNIPVSVINAGTPTTKEVHHLRPKLLPIAYSDNFVNSPSPVISITDIDTITKRISISPSPKFGTFTISNGTFTTGALSVRASASDISSALVSSGITSTSRTYSVAKSGDYSWDIYRTFGTAESLTVTDSGMVGFNSKFGTIDLNTIELEDYLAGEDRATATIEVEYSDGQIKQTIYQGSIVIANDLIENAVYNPIPFPEFSGSGGISDAPSDGNLYARQDGAWVSFQEEDNQGITQGDADLRYAPLSHTHTISNVTGLQTALDGKASTSHNHSFFTLSDVYSQDIQDGDVLRVWNPYNTQNSIYSRANYWYNWSVDFQNPIVYSISWNYYDDMSGLQQEGTAFIYVNINNILKYRMNGGGQVYFSSSGSYGSSLTNNSSVWQLGEEYYGDSLNISIPSGTPISLISYSDSNVTISGGVVVSQGTYAPFIEDWSNFVQSVSGEINRPEIRATGYDQLVMRRGILSTILTGINADNGLTELDGTGNFALVFNDSQNKFSLSKPWRTEGYVSSSELSNYAHLAGATFVGKVNFTSINGASGINIGIGGTNSSSLVNGDLWISTGGTTLNYRDGVGSWRTIATHNQTNTFTTNQIITGASALPMLRITQTGTASTSHAIVVEDSSNPDADSTIIDNNGNVGIGVSNVSGAWTADAKLAIKGSFGALPLVRLTQTGGGSVLLVEDEATPDATPFIIGSDGRVGIGGPVAVNSSNKLALYGGNIIISSGFGIIFGSGTTQVVPYIPSAVAITGGTIDNIVIDGGTF